MNTARPQETQRRKNLFNVVEFRDNLAQTDDPIPLFRQAIEDTRKKLNRRFCRRARIAHIIHDQAWFTDQILVSAWQRYDWGSATDISLLAVGGYGRAELHPYSDIDIQILLGRPHQQRHKASIEAFLTFLWDINLEVGASVRTLQENRDEASRDITVATSLMESRHLVGNPALHARLMATISQKKIWKPSRFFAAKKSEQQARHRKHDDIDYALEPNIKVTPGGLRDIQTIGWIAKRYYAAPDLSSLVKHGFLQKNEYQDLIRGRDFLWRIRYGLHMVTGRREDRLLFDHQRKLATIFDHEDDSTSLGIEKLMQEYYRTVLILRELNDVLLQLFDEDIIRSREKTVIRPLNKSFQIRNTYIEAKHSRVFRNTPSALLEIFVLMAQDREIEGIRASTIRLIRNSIKLIDDDFRQDNQNCRLFMALLRSPHRMVHQLRQMKRYGVLSTYLPEFGRIVGKMQHDLFHIYTVDDHTLQVMENMRRLHHPEAEESFPLAAQVIHRLPKVELLYIAGLYHDIAKGRGGDHSELGAVDAAAFCHRHGLGNWDSNLVCWLVKNHLHMSSVAQREDIQDPDTIRDFAHFVGDIVRLDYLYTLTVCDISATNPSLWNSWRASLLHQLYNSTRRALSQGLEEIVDKDEWVRENQQNATARLKELGFSDEQLTTLWHHANDDYFFRESAADIVWHTQAIARHNSKQALVSLKTNDDGVIEGASQVFIYARNTRFLFANIANAFDRLNLNIQDARIYATEGEYCLQTFMVLEENGQHINDDPVRLQQISNKLQTYADTEELRQTSSQLHTPRKLRHFTRNTETSLSNDDSSPYTTLEVLCPDRPGLLAKVANIFVEKNITLHNAKITTLGENVEDVFFITDQQNGPLQDPVLIEALQQAIRSTLDAETQHA